MMMDGFKIDRMGSCTTARQLVRQLDGLMIGWMDGQIDEVIGCGWVSA